MTVDPKYIAAPTGSSPSPPRLLLKVTPDRAKGKTTAFEPGQNLDTYTSFVDTSVMDPDVTRALTVGGGFGNKKADNNDPKAFTYEFDDNTFPNIPLIQPRLNSVEEWAFTNYNNDEHPIHIHVNDFQVHGGREPTRRLRPPGCSRGRHRQCEHPAAAGRRGGQRRSSPQR